MDPYFLVPSIYLHGCVIKVGSPTQKIASILCYRVSYCEKHLWRELCITYISLKRVGFSSVPRLPGWPFQQLIYGGALPIFPLQAGFPPLISCEKTAPLRQSLQKSPPSFLGLQRLSGCTNIGWNLFTRCSLYKKAFPFNNKKRHPCPL